MEAVHPAVGIKNMEKNILNMNILLKIIIFLFPFFLYAEETKIPALTGRVVDETFTLTEADKAAITDELKKLETEKGSQIAVLVIDTVGELTIEEYGIKVAEAWKLGRKDVSDGAILIAALKDKKMRIEVGRGLEEFLTDLRTKQIQERIIKPEFKNGNFSGGIRQGVEAMITLARGAELPLPEETPEKMDGLSLASFVFALILVGLVLETRFYNYIWRILIAGLSTYIVYWAAGQFSSFLGTVVSTSVSAFFFMLPILFRSSWGGGGSGYSGGGFFSSDSSSGSSGGFSGGGGSFGGGGSSSSWD